MSDEEGEEEGKTKREERQSQIKLSVIDNNNLQSFTSFLCFDIYLVWTQKARKENKFMLILYVIVHVE